MTDQVKATFRLPADLHAALKERAAADRRSLNQELAFLLGQVLFPAVDADAYRDERARLRSMPRYMVTPTTRK